VFHGFPLKKRDSRGNPTGRQCKLNSGKSVAESRNFADSASAFLPLGRVQPMNSWYTVFPMLFTRFSPAGNAPGMLNQI
jgi:hypothetical protein